MTKYLEYAKAIKEEIMSNKPIRHGECLLYPVSEAPKGNKERATSYIVGHSETGHHHVLESKTKFEVTTDEVDKALLYIRLFEPGKLVHKKTVNRHKDLTIPVGTYKIVHKKEYDPFEKVTREVWD